MCYVYLPSPRHEREFNLGDKLSVTALIAVDAILALAVSGSGTLACVPSAGEEEKQARSAQLIRFPDVCTWLENDPCHEDGAGEGNRTLVCSLGSCRSTIELHPRIGFRAVCRFFVQSRQGRSAGL